MVVAPTQKLQLLLAGGCDEEDERLIIVVGCQVLAPSSHLTHFVLFSTSPALLGY
jgi:hypothetical protein